MKLGTKPAADCATTLLPIRLRNLCSLRNLSPRAIARGIAMDTKDCPVTISRITDNDEPMDFRTSRAICDAVGERLEQDLRLESSGLSPHLQHLMDELRRRDGDDRL